MDLSTVFLGMELKNPLVASASPLTATFDGVRKLEDHGIAAVVMHSLFEEEIERENAQIDHFLHTYSHSQAEALTYLPDDVDFGNRHSDHYLEEIRKIKESASIPIIASLNGISPGGWVHYASRLEEAGADGIELNITHVPTSIEMGGDMVEARCIDIVALIRKSVSIPLNIKMSSSYSSPAYMAKKIVEAGANGLSLFDNPIRVDIDLELLTPLRKANITTSDRLSETLRWCAILYKQLSCSICANTGIHTGHDVLKVLMSGADTAALASELLVHGEQRVAEILEEMRRWMEEHEYESVSQMKGSISLLHTDNAIAYERNCYMHALQDYRRE